MIYDQIINILMVAFGTEIVRLYFQVFCWKRRNPLEQDGVYGFCMSFFK